MLKPTTLTINRCATQGNLTEWQNQSAEVGKICQEKEESAGKSAVWYFKYEIKTNVSLGEAKKFVLLDMPYFAVK